MAADRKEIPFIQALKDGDKNALYGLYDMYAGSMYGVIIRIVNDADEANDVLQETFITIWKKIASYDEKKGRFYTWAYRIAKNLSLNRIRKTKKFIQMEDSGVYTIAEEREEQPEWKQLNGLLTQLEPHHQEAIRLVYFSGYTHAEAHQVMDVPLGTFKSYIQQALKRLRAGYQLALLPASMVYVEWIYG